MVSTLLALWAEALPVGDECYEVTTDDAWNAEHPAVAMLTAGRRAARRGRCRPGLVLS